MYKSPSHDKVVTILTGQSQSDAIDIEGFRLAAIDMGAAWTAANITVLAASELDGTYRPLHADGGGELVITAAASRIIGIDAGSGVLAAVRFIRLRSGTTATPVNQAATRTLRLILKS
jgi:hypothetical protein